MERKLRSKERKDAIARSLHSRPLRPINTCGLQTLQTVLGLPVDGFKPDSLGNEAGRREALSNLADVPFADGTSVTVPEPAIPIPRGLGRQEFDVLDAIFIAIDFEYSHYSPKSGRIRLREVGISMFDTRNLYHQNGHLNDANIHTALSYCHRY